MRSLTTPKNDSARKGHGSVREHGIAMIIALVMLIALSLASTLLVRSVSTSNMIAGNLAFQQAAVNSADIGVEAAVDWLRDNNTSTNLHNNSFSNGYVASRQDPAPGQTWDDFWTSTLAAAGQAKTLAADASGNTVSYVIHRLCNAAGDPTSGVDCNVAPSAIGTAGNSKGAGVIELMYNSQIYYRITARVSGPRGTLGYVQTMIAL